MNETNEMSLYSDLDHCDTVYNGANTGQMEFTTGTVMAK